MLVLSFNIVNSLKVGIIF